MVLGETRSVARHWICATPIRKMITATSPFWSRSRFGTLKVPSPSKDDPAAVDERTTPRSLMTPKIIRCHPLATTILTIPRCASLRQTVSNRSL
jgi:hypothetical protein